jgi:hypothetical protein
MIAAITTMTVTTMGISMDAAKATGAMTDCGR